MNLLTRLAKRMGDALLKVHGCFFEDVGVKTSLQLKSGNEDTWKFMDNIFTYHLKFENIYKIG